MRLMRTPIKEKIMDLYKYLQYAAVTSPIVLVIIFLSLNIKSWMDQKTFRRNTSYSVAMEKYKLMHLFDELEENFDDHVSSTPGMQNFNN